MDRSLQIDNIQSFIKVTGNNTTPWKLLLGRDVTHVDRRRGKVFLINPLALQIGLELKTKKINNFKCQDNFIREICSTNNCNTIYPSLLYEEITELIQIKKEETITKKHKNKNKNIEQSREEKQIIKSSNFQINNIPSFVQTIGDNYYLWNLLVGRKVRRFLRT